MFQCLPESYLVGEQIAGLKQLILTCSGGPFLDWGIGDLSRVTLAQAVAHPTGPWAEADRDSATLMNKGLELIEATYLFAYQRVSLM